LRLVNSCRTIARKQKIYFILNTANVGIFKGFMLLFCRSTLCLKTIHLTFDQCKCTKSYYYQIPEKILYTCTVHVIKINKKMLYYCSARVQPCTRFFISSKWLTCNWPCARLSWPSRQLLSARKSTVSYRIVILTLLHDT